MVPAGKTSGPISTPRVCWASCASRGACGRPTIAPGSRQVRSAAAPPWPPARSNPLSATARVADGAAGDRSPSRSEPAPADAAAAAVPQPRPRPVAASKQPQRSARSQAAPARARRRRCACVARGPLRRLGRARLLPARRIPGRLFQLLPVTPPPRCYFAARRGAARVPKLRLSMFAAVAIVPPAAQQGDRYA